jgi:hypothetical protein
MTTELLVFLSFLVIMAAPIAIMAFDSACAYFWGAQTDEIEPEVCCVGKEEDCE